ncbi:hypothetical protein D9757_005252 [Collybiopsis confluens]|uniref:Uncharacterized protein n=1 Tax=Collybiopsis confluens TaxID=2823264 RepID=A0A8H5ME90_9AGAR|nr:hypothetical protein D9757_005252 [Collybiopsis confluens]
MLKLDDESLEYLAFYPDALDPLKNLSCIDLIGSTLLSSELLETINAHTSASTIFFVPNLQSTDDVAFPPEKITVLRGEYWDLAHSPRAQSMNIVALEVTRHDYLDPDSFGCQAYRGLQEVHLDDQCAPITWLPNFALNHPLLNKIVFNFEAGWYSIFHHPPFPDFNITDYRYRLHQLTLTYTSPSSATLKGGPFKDWHISAVKIALHNSTIEVLALVGDAFPELDTLFIDLSKATQDDDSAFDLEYHSDDLVEVLIRFHHLRTIRSNSLFLFAQVPSTAPRSPPPSDCPGRPHPGTPGSHQLENQADSDVRSCVSRIALTVPSLQNVLVREVVPQGLESENGSLLEGRLEVRDGDRSVTGQLLRKPLS